MAKEAARTGVMPTALVAIEQYFPAGRRILHDVLARRMLPPAARAFLQLMRVAAIRNWMVGAIEKSTPGLYSGLICRKRIIDEKVLAARNTIEAIVNLGAGFDTRVYRLPELADVRAWEIDQQGNIEEKTKRLRAALGAVPANVKLVAIDFDHEDLGAVLAAHGYSWGLKTFFIWEAVSQYLTEPGVRSVFEFLAKAVPGSRLAFTYVRKDFLDGTNLYGSESLRKRFVTDQNVWLFGLDPEAWLDFLGQYGFKLVQDAGYEELTDRYVKPTGRTLASMAVERVIFAEKV